MDQFFIHAQFCFSCFGGKLPPMVSLFPFLHFCRPLGSLGQADTSLLSIVGAICLHKHQHLVYEVGIEEMILTERSQYTKQVLKELQFFLTANKCSVPIIKIYLLSFGYVEDIYLVPAKLYASFKFHFSSC